MHGLLNLREHGFDKNRDYVVVIYRNWKWEGELGMDVITLCSMDWDSTTIFQPKNIGEP